MGGCAADLCCKRSMVVLANVPCKAIKAILYTL